MTRPTGRGGRRPGAGRKPHAEPQTVQDAVAALDRYVGPGAWTGTANVDGRDLIVLDLAAACKLLLRIRGRPWGG